MSRRSLDLSVYLVTARRLCASRGVLETVRLAVAGGVTIVQLRDPEAEARALVEEARALVALLRPLGIPLIVNDRADVAVAADADGVHVGQGDLAPRDVRAIIGPDRLLGLSVGTPDELAASAADLSVVDYVGVGPVRSTSTKSDAGRAIGLAGLADLRRRINLPIVGIGGVGPDIAADIIGAGADGVAVVSAICAAPDPAEAARDLAMAVRATRSKRSG